MRVIKAFVAGEKKDYRIQFPGVEPADEIKAVFLRHLNIGKDNIDVRILFYDMFGFLCAVGGILLRNPQLIPIRIHADIFYNIKIVVNNQYFHECTSC